MLYLFHGSDVAKTRAKAFQWVAAARAKEPNASYIRLDAASLTESTLLNALSAQGLFFTKTLVLIDDPFSESEAGELVVSQLKLLASSDNPVALLAPKLLATRLKKIEPHATKIFEHAATEKKSDRGFNSALVNALGAKDGKVLWKEIVKAHRQGDAPEMVHGLLHWKARDLMQKNPRLHRGLTSIYQGETSMKSMKWEYEEARALSRALIELVSDSRSGSLELSLALERFALTLNS